MVGSRLNYWLAREDLVHQDPFGPRGLVTSPPTDRVGYIWVGDGGEPVPAQQIKYLTDTIVEEPGVAKLERPETYPSSSPKLASVLGHSLARALLGHGFLAVPTFP